MLEGILKNSKKFKIKRLCEFCGEEFEVLSNSSPQKFCNSSCFGKNRTFLKNKDKKFDVWLICQNPDCTNDSYPNHAFLVSFSKANSQKFCSIKCAAKVRSNTPEFKKRVGNQLREANKNRKELYPEWDNNNKKAVRELIIKRNKTSKMRESSSRILSKVNKERKELYPEWYENQQNAVRDMFKSPEFLLAHKLRWQETLKNLHNDLEFINRRDNRASETFRRLWKNPEFALSCKNISRDTLIKLRQSPEFYVNQKEAARKVGHKFMTQYNYSKEGIESRRNNFIKKIKNGDLCRAQKLLFDYLCDLNPQIKEFLCMEKIVYLTDNIVNKYLNSNKSHYRIDIACVIDDRPVLAIEVDGRMGHSTEEDLCRDEVRDIIMLEEFGIKTLRVTNDEVFKDVKEVVELLIDEINSQIITVRI